MTGRLFSECLLSSSHGQAVDGEVQVHNLKKSHILVICWKGVLFVQDDSGEPIIFLSPNNEDCALSEPSEENYRSTEPPEDSDFADSNSTDEFHTYQHTSH